MRYHLIGAKKPGTRRAKDVLVFFNGWGMDEYPFLAMGGATADLLIVSDYSSFDNAEELFGILDGYEKRTLIAWSMGVWAAQFLCATRIGYFSYGVAVNGTLQPIHPRYGIEPAVFAEMSRNFSEQVRDSFYQQMCRKELPRFLVNAPQRTLESQGAELAYLFDHAQDGFIATSMYDTALISSKDVIIPTSHQKDFWHKSGLVIISGSHYPFWQWHSMEECLQLCQAKSKL